MPTWRENYLKGALGAKKPKSRWPGPLGEVATRNFAKREQFGHFFPCAPRQIPCASRHFGACFGALSGVQNVPKCTCWKAYPVYFPTQLEFLKLKLICPSKTSFSQDCFLCVQKVAERPFLGVFWPLGGPKRVKISFPDTSRHIFGCWIQICRPFLD